MGGLHRGIHRKLHDSGLVLDDIVAASTSSPPPGSIGLTISDAVAVGGGHPHLAVADTGTALLERIGVGVARNLLDTGVMISELVTTTGATIPGVVYYVDAATGNDSNPGTQSHPWKTLAKANTAAKPGVTVVLNGTFTGQVLAPVASGTAALPITYRALSPWSAILDGPGMVGATPYCVYLGARAYIVLDGLAVQNSNYVNAPVANKGIVLRSSSYCTIRNCSFNHMQMQLIGSHHNKIQNNVWRQFVASYINPATNQPDPNHPTTSGDMLNLVLGSHDNEISGNDMKYAGHSLIEIGNGWGPTNAANWIHDNVLDNPWYKPMILADDGGGTIIENNQLLNSCSVPTLYSTLPQSSLPVGWPKDGKAYAEPAVQLDGKNYIFRNNTIDNAVSTYGVISMGARWYYGPGAPVGGALVESKYNQVYGNTFSNCKGAATFSFAQNYTPGKDVSVPTMTGNLTHDNKIINAQPTVYSWDGTLHYETVMFRSFKGAVPWAGLNGNKVYSNTGFSSTNTYRSSYVNAAGATATLVETLAQFQASDPADVYGNT